MGLTQTTVDEPRSNSGGPDLMEAFATMVLIRVYETRLLDLRTAGEVVGPVHPYIGQEAIAVGVCAALSPRDSIASHYRGHGHVIARGTPLEPLTAELFGRADGLCGGKAAALVSDPERKVLVSSGIVGGGIPIAAGAAMAAQVTGDGSVAVAFLGEGALGSGVVHEVLNLAAAQRLPLILVCENNGYQGATRTEEVYPDTSVLRIARAHHWQTARVDGNDVTAVYDAAQVAVAVARGGGGPTFIEADTYLTKFHLQFDTPSSEVRPEAELNEWLARDPMSLLTARLVAEGVAQDRLAGLRERAEQDVERAVEYARSAPWPDRAEVFTDVWAEES